MGFLFTNFPKQNKEKQYLTGNWPGLCFFFVLISRVLSANRVDFGLVFVLKFFQFYSFQTACVECGSPDTDMAWWGRGGEEGWGL